jgi:hypothetical protein
MRNLSVVGAEYWRVAKRHLSVVGAECWRTAKRNRSSVGKVLAVVAVVAVVFGTLLAWAFNWLEDEFPLPPDDAVRVQYLAQYVALVQVIAVGVVVTLLGVIIPLMLPGARDRFERFKESRQAYSRAKTAVIYLPDRVVKVDREKAFLLVEKAHREIHLAETFEDVIIKKGYLRWFANPDLWLLYNYWQIVAVATVLREYDWSGTEDRNMLRDRLEKALQPVHACFGPRGEKCAGQKWHIRHGEPEPSDPEDTEQAKKDPKNLSRFHEEDRLKKEIEATLAAIKAAEQRPSPAAPAWPGAPPSLHRRI